MEVSNRILVESRRIPDGPDLGSGICAPSVHKGSFTFDFPLFKRGCLGRTHSNEFSCLHFPRL